MAKAPRKTTSTTTKGKKSAPKRASKAASDSKPAASARAKAVEAEIVDPEIIEPEHESTGEGPDFDLRSEFDAMDDIEIDPDRDVIDVPTETPKPLPAKAPRSGRAPKSVTAEVVDSSSKALATADPVALYLAEIRRYPLLTKEQERELAVRYRETGDPKAAEMLVTSNLRFVVKVAAEYSRFGAKLIDLVQEGNVGLMHAVKEFNPYKGVRLITYAVWWIRGYIQEYLMRQYSLVRIGTTQNQRKLFYRLQKEREAIDALGQEPTVALLAGRLGVSEEEVETMSKRLSGRDVSLSQPVDGGTSTATLLDFEASDAPSVDDTIGHLEEMEVLKRKLDEIRADLNEKELFILDRRVLADDPMTLQEIGEHYGVTREAVRQLEARLIGKIRNAVTSSLAASLGADSSEDADDEG